MINIKLIGFLQFREKILDVNPLERKYGISLPPIYRAFISTFKPFLAHHKVLKGENGEFQSFLVPFYSSLDLDSYSIDDELSFESFKEVEDVLSFERSNKGYLKDLLFISDHGFSGGLLVGIGEHNLDKIFFNADSTIIEPLANNIFEIIHKMNFVQYDFNSPPVDTSKIYMKWGEDFWRYTEEE